VEFVPRRQDFDVINSRGSPAPGSIANEPSAGGIRTPVLALGSQLQQQTLRPNASAFRLRLQM
jgi:hypothetical protein